MEEGILTNARIRSIEHLKDAALERRGGVKCFILFPRIIRIKRILYKPETDKFIVYDPDTRSSITMDTCVFKERNIIAYCIEDGTLFRFKTP